MRHLPWPLGIPQSSSLSRQVLNPNPPPTTDPSRLVVFSCSRTWLAQGSTSFEYVSKPPLSPPTAEWEKKWFLKPTHETHTTRCLKCGKSLDCDIIYQVVRLCTLLLPSSLPPPCYPMCDEKLDNIYYSWVVSVMYIIFNMHNFNLHGSYLHEYKLQTDCILSLNAKHCSSKKLCTWQWLLLEFLSLPKVATIFHRFVPM